MTRHADADGQLRADAPRSRNMAAIRRSDTKPELALRSALHRAGFRFRKDYVVEAAGVKTRPDIVFTRARIAVFVDGCFWHSCPVHGVKPKSNVEFWSSKLARNVERDLIQRSALTEGGWTVVRIWEHEPLAEAFRQVTDELIGS